MTRRQRPPILALCAALFAATAAAGARQASTAPPQPTTGQQVPSDPQVTIGRFENGLRYYIRENKRPEKRAELRLVVNAGSIDEEGDQLGLAHFVEHMAFNGTKNFPKQETVKFLESIGMRFGPSVNAFTSFDETVYMLQVPTDNPEILDKSFLILEDWAQNLSFDPAEIDKERGVILEEWRLRRGASARMLDKQLPILLKGSRYADRLPIGTAEVIQNFKHDRLKKFYADWYKPDVMAVVAVGDFDKATVQKLIEQHFGSLAAPAAPTKRTAYDVPDQPGTLYAIATDKEATSTSVAVYRKHGLRDPSTEAAYRQQIVEGLFGGMLSARFSEIAQKPDAPFLGAGAGRGLFVRTKEVTVLNALVKQDAIEPTLDVLFTEMERVARFGFTEPELERQKRNILRNLEQAVVEKDTQFSANFAAQYMAHFTQGTPIPDAATRQALHQRFLPGITLQEINALAKQWATDDNRVVLVSAPEKEGVAAPDERKLAAVMAAVASKDVKPYVDTISTAPLLDPLPDPGPITKTTVRDTIGITEWELANGVKVVLKPTNFKEDEIELRAFSPGGISLASDADIIAARTAVQVVTAGGVGTFSAVDLPKVLSGKVASVSPFIGETEEGLNGSASRKDLETLFQLIHLRFTRPRPDENMFKVITQQMETLLARQRAMPEFAFSETLQKTMTQEHPRARMMSPELIPQMSLEKSMAFYKDRFGDASDFTFVFVGSFDVDAMKPLVERYLGSLPAVRRKETWRDVGIRPPTGVIEKRVDKGLEPKSRADITFTGPFEYNQTERVAIRAMADVLTTRLREKLREDLGGTYSVGASAGYTRFPRSEYSLSIDFGCSPDRTEELLKTVFDEIELLKTSGPTEQQANDVREKLLRDHEVNMKQNRYLLTQIAFKYQYGEDPATVLVVPDYYRKINPGMIQQAARTYLNTKNYVKVTLFPEKTSDAPQVPR
jgi:zinc protease